MKFQSRHFEKWCMWNRYLYSAAVLFLFVPQLVSADMVISEIMYDPEGSDSSGSHFRDWVEVYNSGAPVDLSAWKFFEGGSNHGITTYSGSGVIPTGEYAVFVDDPALF